MTLQDNQKTFQSLIQVQARSPQVKIIPFDPKEILRAQNELRQQQLVQATQSRLLGDNQQLFLIQTNDSEGQTGPADQRDILQEATEQILQDQQQQQQQQPVNLSDLVITNNIVVDCTNLQQHPPTELAISSPGFVRVTPKYITVKSPLAKKPQRVKKRLWWIFWLYCIILISVSNCDVTGVAYILYFVNILLI